MKWKERIKKKGWRKMFCFLPIKVEDTWVWLEYVEVKFPYDEPDAEYTHEYRLIK